MKINHKIKFLIVILCIGAALGLSACDNGPAALSFEKIGKQTGYINNVVTASSIEVITGLPAADIANLSAEDQFAVRQVDYSRYFVLVVTFGHGIYIQDEILKISQFKEVVWVQTSLEEKSTEGGSNYQIVKVPKDEMIRYGNITFRLLYKGMGELAKASQTISAP